MEEIPSSWDHEEGVQPPRFVAREEMGRVCHL